MEQDKIVFEEILKEAQTKGTVSRFGEFFDLYRKYINARTQNTKCSSCVRTYMVSLSKFFDSQKFEELVLESPKSKFEKLKNKVPKVI